MSCRGPCEERLGSDDLRPSPPRSTNPVDDRWLPYSQLGCGPAPNGLLIRRRAGDVNGWAISSRVWSSISPTTTGLLKQSILSEQTKDVAVMKLTIRPRGILPLIASGIMAIGITVTALYSGARTLFSSGVPSKPTLSFTTSDPATPQDKQTCEARLSKLNSQSLHSKPGSNRDPQYLYQQTGIAPNDLRSNSVVPPYPESSGSNVPYASGLFFFAQYSVQSLDLDSRTSVLGFSVRIASSIVPTFPVGTSASLAIGTLTGGTQSVQLQSDLLGGGYSFASAMLPLSGNSNAYPNDEYEIAFFRLSVTVTSPTYPTLVFPIDLGYGYISLPVQSAAYVHAVPGELLRLPDAFTCATPAFLTFTRRGNAPFLWGMALIPTILLFLFLYSTKRTEPQHFKNQDRRLADSPSIGTVEVAIAFLSILPLRSILVPSGINALTRIDYLLGLELSLLVLALVANQLNHLRRRSRGTTITMELSPERLVPTGSSASESPGPTSDPPS